MLLVIFIFFAIVARISLIYAYQFTMSFVYDFLKKKFKLVRVGEDDG